MITYTIQEIIDWVPFFSFQEILIQKECFFCFIWVLKVSLRLTLIQKRGLYPLRLLPLMRVLFVPFQSVAPESSWLGGTFLKYYKKICKIKNEGNENKMMLGVLNCTMDKINRVGENKTQRLCSCCSNYALSKLIVGNGLADLWRRENSNPPESICYNRSFTKDQYRPSILIFGKGPIEADELGGIWVLPSP